jgi:hypothetical protein
MSFANALPVFAKKFYADDPLWADTDCTPFEKPVRSDHVLLIV